jgi:streptogramin lyase
MRQRLPHLNPDDGGMVMRAQLTAACAALVRRRREVKVQLVAPKRRQPRRAGYGIPAAVLLALFSGMLGTASVGAHSSRPVITVPGVGETVTPLGDVLKAQAELSGNPDWLAGYGGFVWVKRDSGMVSKIDPASGQQVSEVRADTKSDQYCQGIGAGGGAVWSCSGSDVVRIDPQSVTVTASVPVGKIFDQGRLVYAAGRIWVIGGRNGDKLIGIDTKSLVRTRPVALGRTCADLGSGNGSVVWVICRDANAVLRFDPRTLRVTKSVKVGAPTVAMSASGTLWVGTDTDVVRFDAHSLRRVATFPDLAPGYGGDLIVAPNGAWIRTERSFLSRIDPKTNRVVEQIRPPAALPGGSALFFAGALWTDASDANHLYQLSRS